MARGGAALNTAFRLAVSGAFVLVAGAQVIRTGLVSAGAGPSEALWQSHPAVLRSQALAEVGAAAARGEAPGAATLARAELLADEQPLASEPFLLQAALAVRARDYRRAEALLVEARRRAPRSPAARYLLADLYLRTGRPLPAMAEMAVLNRLVPGSALQLAPALAAYARTPGALRQIRAILAAYPELEPGLLKELAADTRNVDLVLQLAGPQRAGAGTATWQQTLLAKLIEEGGYARAHAIWKRLAGVENAAPGLFNPSFAPLKAPPPFNWELAGGTAGVVEPRDGGLQLLYFGRDDVAFAKQVMLLPPGRYRLAMNVSGNVGAARSLAWKVACLAGGGELLDLPLGAGTVRGRVAGEFTVPQGCSAQRIELSATGQEFPERADFRISALALTRAGAS